MLERESDMPITQERIYQTSDLAGRGRKEFIEAAQRGPTTLRTPEGESLVMLPAATLDHLSRLRDHALNFLMLDNAMSRPAADRRPADFGAWAFIAPLDEDQLVEFRSDMNAALVRAGGGEDVSIVDAELNAWRPTARAMADEVTRSILSGDVPDSDWLEASPQAWSPEDNAGLGDQ